MLAGKIALFNRGVKLNFWALSLVGILLGALPSVAKTISVTNTNDAGAGSLRQAIATAVNNDTIKFNLQLPAIISLNSPLTIGTNITISGPGAASGVTPTSGPPPFVQLPLVIAGSGSIQDFIINAGANVEITGMSIVGGNAGSGNGGGISNAGELVLIGVSLVNNTAAWGGGIFNTGKLFVFDSAIGNNQASKVFTGNDFNDFTRSGRARGGAIYNLGEDPSLPAFVSLTNTSIIANQAGSPGQLAGAPHLSTNGDGSGIYNDQGTMSLTNCMVWQNEGDFGGGIFNSVAATLTLSGTTVYDNFGVAGAGLYNNGAVTATNSTFYQNHAVWYGGGIYQFVGYQNIPGSLALVSSTIAHNEADGTDSFVIGGGGIFGGYVSFKNSVIAEHGVYGNCAQTNIVGVQGNNFSDDRTCSSFDSDQLSGLDPAGLKDNGGPTWTVSLVSDSPLIDSIPDYLCTDANGNRLRIDQRGVPRPQGNGCDIGAFEVVKPTTLSGNPVVAVQLYGLEETVRVAPLPTIPQAGLNILLQATVEAVNQGNDKLATGDLNLFVGSVNFLARVGVIDTNLGADLTVPAQGIIQNLATGGGTTLQ